VKFNLLKKRVGEVTRELGRGKNESFVSKRRKELKVG
jgi:hypothetical protein